MAEKTEAPSSKRLSEAREEGQIARSQELITAAILIVSVWLLQGPGTTLVSELKFLITHSISSLPTVILSEAGLREILYVPATHVLPSLGMIVLGLMLTGIVVTGLQTGFLWANKRVGIQFSRLNPINGFKRIFSAQGLIQLGKGLIKIVVLGWVSYSYISVRMQEIMMWGQMDLLSGMTSWAQMAIGLVTQVGGFFFVLAAADYGFERWRYMKNLRMTKEEVKEEMKQSEGDPFMKSRIRGEMRRMARQRMMANVRKATVVITNPTHLAIALEYGPDMAAPKVVGKGAYLIAERIVKIAKDQSIPVVQNIPVARALYKVVELDQDIPPDLYMAVAEVLAYVYRIKAGAPSLAGTRA